MKTRTLGPSALRVSAVGLGCIGMSDLYGAADEAESIATIRAALEAGITLLDTGDFYGMGHNEPLLRDALRGRARDQVVLSVKFGAQRDPAGGSSSQLDPLTRGQATFAGDRMRSSFLIGSCTVGPGANGIREGSTRSRLGAMLRK